MNIGLIPLKTKSRRLYNKNFLDFCDTKLLLHTIEKMQKSNSFDAIIISTDEPIEVSKFIRLSDYRKTVSCQVVTHHNDLVDLSGIIILKRGNNLCEDSTTTEAVVFDTINKIDLRIGSDSKYTITICQVTSPNWKPHIIRYALEQHNQKKKTIVSVSPDFKPNGCIYIIDKYEFLRTSSIYTPDIFLLRMTWDESVDIDYYHQLCIANAIGKGNYDDR